MGSGGSVFSQNCVEMIQIVPNIYHYQEIANNKEIDIEALVLALRKLSCLFVDKNYLNQSFIETVLNPKYKKFDSKFLAVAMWIGKHDKYAKITPYELFSLIKYVELCRPLKSKTNCVLERNSYDPFEDVKNLQLSCPRKDGIPVLTGKIRAREAKILSFGKSEQFLPPDNTVRVRTLSADDLSSVDFDEYHDI